MTYELDSNGIPRLSREDIERRAEGIVRYFRPEVLADPGPAPLIEVCKWLSDQRKLKLVFDEPLGELPDGSKIRGQFHIPSKTIHIDPSLEPGSPRFNFTLAHELGHFIFHRNITVPSIGVEISDSKNELQLDHLESDNPRTWIEWQANKFAASLLVPRATVGKALRDVQDHLGISRSGYIYLDSQRGNKRDYLVVMDALIDLYHASRTCLKLRLRELGLLRDAEQRPSVGEAGLSSLFDIFGNMGK